MEPIHVYPLNDIRKHILMGLTCWCNPKDDNGNVIHNSLDERELFEEGKRKPS